ncbi:hypothetical protein FE810_15790 [Thalassotalea litorea]|uniref:Uncharacterized protein n=1 Tax=Thalassotalea litorea TaxID=2020715 RepID=A0A5R9IBR1_9GAMM|nr:MULTISPECIES: hypothetical protein [Thalassotalea]QDP00146.1 hypothetical protein FNC98_01555 [Thalassotalea sp. PS06]TLU61046.1 hypothetical protein FE810_15790 [Thalassotalea litorea]
MQPSKPLPKFINGLKNALKVYGATQRDQYSWISKTENHFVFTAEQDHKDKERNIYNHKDGVFVKKVRALSKDLGDAPLTVSHGKELFDAVNETFTNNNDCRLLIVKGTKYGTSSGGVRAVMDNDLWRFTSFSGTVEQGFEFVLERVKAN